MESTCDNPSSEVKRFTHPKIAALDLAPDVTEALIKRGFDVSTGSFGGVYKVSRSHKFLAIPDTSNLDGITEKEVVIVDLSIAEVASNLPSKGTLPAGEQDLFAGCHNGLIDTRARPALLRRKTFNRILENGGVFVVFAQKKLGVKLQLARPDIYGELYEETSLEGDAWSFLSELSDMVAESDTGLEMAICEKESQFGALLSRHLQNGSFTCTLKGGYRSGARWIPLAKNKYGDAVALFRLEEGKGLVIVLPQLADKSAFLCDLLLNVLPEVKPLLFPEFEGVKWVHHSEFEHKKVSLLRTRQAEIRTRAQIEIDAIEKEIIKEQSDNEWMHDLLTGTDETLVVAVERALRSIGFQKIRDIDEERDAEGKSRREDLQIEDSNISIVVDIKGLGGLPTDADALQANKHAVMRMREENRANIIGLSIINHQRRLPPLERENALPFRKEILSAAEEYVLGLMTSFDLYRLVRNALLHKWDPKHCMPLFYESGRVAIIPKHYRYLGKTAKDWTEFLAVVIEHGEVSVGDRLAVEFPIEFEEIKVDSIRVNQVSVAKATVGEPAGFLWSKGQQKLRQGLRVYKVETS
jgi:hypothetical protein